MVPQNHKSDTPLSEVLETPVWSIVIASKCKYCRVYLVAIWIYEFINKPVILY